jgi:hypothetical protein
MMLKAGSLWDTGSRWWLIEPRRLGPVIRAPRRETDLLFPRAGHELLTGIEGVSSRPVRRIVLL